MTMGQLRVELYRAMLIQSGIILGGVAALTQL